MRAILAAALGAACLLLSGTWSGQASAHEGHDDEPVTATPIAPRGASVSDRVELVAVAGGGRLRVYLDRRDSNEPVAEAVVEAETPDGLVTATRTEPGTWELPAPWIARPGEHEVVFTVTADGSTDVFPVSLDIHGPADPGGASGAATVPPVAASLRDVAAPVGLVLLGAGLGFALSASSRRRKASALSAAVLALMATPAPSGRAHEGHRMDEAAAAAAAPRDRAQRLGDGALFVPKPTQRLLQVRTLVADEAAHRVAVELPGRVLADPNGSGLVQSALGGRLSPPPGGFPRLGTPVKAGDLLATATPPIQAIDVSDMLQRQGELDQQISIVERRLARLEPLARSGAVTQAQLEETRLELRGLRERRAGLDAIRRQPEPLLAPIDGVVAEANAVAGQMAQPNAVVFQVIDPRRLLVEALSFEAPAGLSDASARWPGGHAGLRFLGSGLADRNQAVPVHFVVTGDAAGLRIGQFVTVTASGAAGRAGIAVPRASVVRGANGQAVVFRKTAPERFEPREVRTEPLDGERVLVASGLSPGDRVVTDGAELLNQVR